MKRNRRSDFFFNGLSIKNGSGSDLFRLHVIGLLACKEPKPGISFCMGSCL